MSDGAVPLSAYASPKVLLRCRSCDRRGRIDKAALIERAGGDSPLPTLRLKFVAGLGCELARATKNGEHLPGFAQCGADYPELLLRYRAEKEAGE